MKTFGIRVYETKGKYITLEAKNEWDAYKKAQYVLETEGLKGFKNGEPLDDTEHELMDCQEIKESQK